MHQSTFQYHNPTEAQKIQMEELRVAAAIYASAIDHIVPEGPDKTYLLRKLREVASWVNIAITRLPDGTPRQ